MNKLSPQQRRKIISDYRRFLKRMLDEVLIGRDVMIYHTYQINDPKIKALAVLTAAEGGRWNVIWRFHEEYGGFRDLVPPFQAMDLVYQRCLNAGISEAELKAAGDFGQFDHSDNDK